LTLRWRGMDSNFQYAEAVKLVVAPFSCAGCLGRVGAPVGVGVLRSGITTEVIIRSRVTISRASSSRPICA